ncbi:hypothetical protein D3C83_311150 [compost metagenome]
MTDRRPCGPISTSRICGEAGTTKMTMSHSLPSSAGDMLVTREEKFWAPKAAEFTS